MKRLMIIIMGLCLLLASCQERNNDQEADGTDFVSTRYPEVEIPLSEVDFHSYQGELSQEDWEALSAYFPVLTEGETLKAAHLPSVGDDPVPLKEQEGMRLNDIFSDYGFEDPPAEFTLTSFALCDVTGDGRKELALYSNFRSGLNCVIHREGDAFYGVYMPIRWFEGLQENGIYWGSGGAATSYYERLHFEDGIVWVELLGSSDWEAFFIDEKEVDEVEFEQWREELLAGEVAWHVARTVQ